MISNRISVTSASRHQRITSDTASCRSAAGVRITILSHGASQTHTQSHGACIGGDLDTDPALRFRIGGSYNLSPVSKNVKKIGESTRIARIFPGPGPDHGNDGDPGIRKRRIARCNCIHLLIPGSCVLSRGRSAHACACA